MGGRDVPVHAIGARVIQPRDAELEDALGLDELLGHEGVLGNAFEDGGEDVDGVFKDLFWGGWVGGRVGRLRA